MTAATAAPPPVAQRTVPDPGEPVAALSWPTVAVFAGAGVVFGISCWATVGHHLPAALTILLATAACFAMFTVAHDASHYSISTTPWVNRLFGRLAMLFVSPLASFTAFGFVHIEHHRNTNDGSRDPDHFVSHGPWWQLPLRFAVLDWAYVVFYLRNIRRRPLAEVAESSVLMTLTFAGIAASIATGTFWVLAVAYLIPVKAANVLTSWWFDWLPHHGLDETQTENRYRATRVRVGLERLLTPLMLAQNYHLVHHLHPSIPFFRYLTTWRRNEDAYLENGAAITTAFGKTLDADAYREWKGIAPEPTTRGAFHRLTVASVEPLTADSTLVTFEVPEHLRDEFRFEPGQHIAVRTNLGDRDRRRLYSICAPATGTALRIAVKHLPGGVFSTYVAEELKVGDALEVMPPAGTFCPALDPRNAEHYAAIAAGSGITPILSIIETALQIETASRFTLIYGNRTAASTMFRRELDELQTRFGDRLAIRHVLSREPDCDPELLGRIDRANLDRWLSAELKAESVRTWFLCGPIDLITTARETLLDHGVAPEHVRLELFHGYDERAKPSVADAPSATVAFTLSGRPGSTQLNPGDSVLEAVLKARPDAPYACMGGACGTCKAKLVEGTVEMDHNFALGQEEVDAGYVLTCQAHPTCDAVSIDFDQ